jgi:hypothetical protein
MMCCFLIEEKPWLERQRRRRRSKTVVIFGGIDAKNVAYSTLSASTALVGVAPQDVANIVFF